MDINRREFLKVLGAAGATTLAGCAYEAPEKLIPYLIPHEEIIPGEALWYASTCRECPAGCGLLVKTREGRAIKVEGNPHHPVNQGRLCARGQASVQGLYNPDRIREPLRRNPAGSFQPIKWEEAEEFLAESLAAIRGRGMGDQIVFISPLVTGSFDRLIGDWLKALGSQRLLRYEPFSYEPLRAANRICFDRDAIPTYRLDDAKLILSLGADFLETWISPVEFAQGFSKMRRPDNGRMGRFIYIGPRLSLTAANADEWISPKPGSELFLVLGMVRVILEQGLAASLPQQEREEIRTLARAYDPKTVAARTEVPAEKIIQLARDFAAQKPALALAGGISVTDRNATATAVATNLLNYVTGNVGKTVRFGPTSNPAQLSSYRDLVSLTQTMARGEIQALFLYDVNPLFTLPPSAGFANALKRVPLVVALSSFMDETTAAAHLVLPPHTALESWGDYSPQEGVRSLMQPAMRPLFNTKDLGDFLIAVAKRMGERMAGKFPWGNFYDYLRDQWKEIHQQVDAKKEFESFWEESLQQGGVWREVRPEPVRLNLKAISGLKSPIAEPKFDGDGTFYLSLYPSLSHFDGRGANRPWLQELPDPMTSIVWYNWLEVHPQTAKRLQITEGDVISISSPYGKAELPAHLSEGVRPDVVAIPIGQGHTNFGRYGSGRGVNPVHLLPPDPEPQSGALAWLSVKVTLNKTGKRIALASVAGSDRQDGRGIAQVISVASLSSEAKEKELEEEPKQIYAPHEHPKHRWGMVIDLNACTGCSACVVACNAENNISVVGKEQIAKGREMAWIQIQRYIEEQNPQSAIRNPKFMFLPMLCQQCDHAPCEAVCPLYATYHTPEGLNAQVYNRCVGVRYCANNCPYKVRRFNWLQYDWPEPLNLQLNPDVTVRSMGIMEKCTFCVQRIRAGENRAKVEGRSVRDGEIVPACAQTCPTEAIVFGDLKDSESKVAKLSRDQRRYRVLEHLGTQPAITYLKKVKSE